MFTRIFTASLFIITSNNPHIHQQAAVYSPVEYPIATPITDDKVGRSINTMSGEKRWGQNRTCHIISFK